MYTIAICDDEQTYREIIYREAIEIFSKLQIFCDFEIFENGEALLDSMKAGKSYDMIFLDIVMGECSGLDVAEKIYQSTNGDNLIFVSTEEQYVFDTFAFRPLAFIKKSDISDRMEATIQRWIDNRKDKYITFLYDNMEKLIAYRDFIYMESIKHYLYIYTKDTVYQIRKRISDYKYLVDEEEFISPHISYICNLEYVYDITKTDIILKDKKRIPLSRGKVQECNDKYLRYIRSKL